MTSRLPQSVLLDYIKQLRPSKSKRYHDLRNNPNYCKHIGTMRVISSSDVYYEEIYTCRCTVCSRKETFSNRYPFYAFKNGNFLKSTPFMKRHVENIILMIIISLMILFVACATTLSYRADKSMEKKLEQADKEYIYKNKEVATCRVFSDDSSDIRFPVDCIVIEKSDVGKYTVKFTSPDGEEKTANIRALDMSKK